MLSVIKLTTVANGGYITATTVCELLHKLAEQHAWSSDSDCVTTPPVPDDAAQPPVQVERLLTQRESIAQTRERMPTQRERLEAERESLSQTRQRMPTQRERLAAERAGQSPPSRVIETEEIAPEQLALLEAARAGRFVSNTESASTIASVATQPEVAGEGMQPVIGIPSTSPIASGSGTAPTERFVQRNVGNPSLAPLTPVPSAAFPSGREITTRITNTPQTVPVGLHRQEIAPPRTSAVSCDCGKH
jgi:hypothetical protein